MLGKGRHVGGDRRIDQRKLIFILEERDSAGLEVPAGNLCLTGLPEYRGRKKASRKRDEPIGDATQRGDHPVNDPCENRSGARRNGETRWSWLSVLLRLRNNDIPHKARADEPCEVAGQVEIRIVGKGSFGRLAERPACGEREQECCATRRQRADFYFEIRARDERVLAAPILDWRKLLLAAVHRPDRDDRIWRANDFGRGVNTDADTPDSMGIERRKVARADGRGVGRMIGACARGLEPRHVCKIG